jgi:predicted Zn-dependent protease
MDQQYKSGFTVILKERMSVLRIKFNEMKKATLLILMLSVFSSDYNGVAQIAGSFKYKMIEKGPIKSIWAKGNGDYDGDGHIDFMIGGEGTVIWYENPAGMDTTAWIKHIAYNGPKGIGFEGSASGDIDNDGDIDIIIGGYYTNVIYCLENPGKGQGIWKLHNLGGPKTDATYLHDFDNDGKLDIITRASELYSAGVGRDIFIWKQGENPFSAEDWQRFRKKEVGTGEHFNIGDVDSDGNMDFIVDKKWYCNNGNINPANWIETVFTTAWDYNNTFPFVADINNDGYNDIVLTPTERLNQTYKTAWYEAPQDPTKSNWIEHIIDDNVQCVTHSLGVYDFDCDGNLDVFTAEMEQGDDPDEVRIYFNKDGGKSWTKKVLSPHGSHWNQFVDFDSDGDIDIFGANHGSQGPPAVDFWENQTNPPIPLDNFHLILIDNKREQPRNFGVAVADVTGDGNSDIAAGRYFYRNPGGDMCSNWKRTLLPGKPTIDAMLFTDVDGDEFGDVIAEDLPGVYWLEADNKQGSSWTIRSKIGEIPSGPHNSSAQGYILAQVIAGGKPEILLSSRGVYYFEIPPDPEKSNWPQKRITESPNSEEGIGSGDIDNDGDIDVCGSINSDAVPNAVGWYENPGDGGNDWIYHQVGTVARWADRFYMADINKDGRTDIVISTANGTEDGVYWFEAPENPKETSWERHTVIAQDLSNSMDVADMDNDGDTDIILGQHYTGKMMTPRKLNIFENDGHGNFSQHLIHSGVESHLGARVFNLDGDGDLDIVNIGYSDWQYLYIWRNDGIGR